MPTPASFVEAVLDGLLSHPPAERAEALDDVFLSAVDLDDAKAMILAALTRIDWYRQVVAQNDRNAEAERAAAHLLDGYDAVADRNARTDAAQA